MRISDWSSDVCSSDLNGAADCWSRPFHSDRRDGAGSGRRSRQLLQLCDAQAQRLGITAQTPRAKSREDAGPQRATHAKPPETGGARKSVVEGKSVFVRVDLGGWLIL